MRAHLGWFLFLPALAGCSLLIDDATFREADGGDDAGLRDAGPLDGGNVDAGMRDGGQDCGNGTRDPGEQCDDGNVFADDGCSDTCEMEAGFNCSGAGAGSCTAICGDGMVVGDEMCDDGFETACGACNADCSGTGTVVRCGDGMVCADTESCDDMNTDDGDGCASDCAMIEPAFVCSGEPSVCAMTCGNNMLDTGETCDDGGLDDGDGCSAACMEESGFSCTGEPSVCLTTCGDSIIAGDEMCDDGDTDNDDGCSDTCVTEPGWDCVGMPSNCTEACGDSMVVGAEVCDDGNTVTESACAYGMPTCTLCNASCTMELALMGGVCGDSVVDVGSEMCDDGNQDACGLCSTAVCTGPLTAAPAMGTLVVSDGNTTPDGSQFRLSDGEDVVTFELDPNNNDVRVGTVRVVIPVGAMNEGMVASQVRLAINNQPDLDITVSRSGGTLTLFNDANGVQGNVLITTTPDLTDPLDGSWTVTGMTGGVGRTCSGGLGCTDNDDCISGMCVGNVCTMP